jgi:hypothetical protein
MLALAMIYSWSWKTLDVAEAFLNGDVIGLPVCIDPPPGYKKPGKIIRLRKMLYGLKEAPLAWYLTFLRYLEKIGFQKTVVDQCLFVRKSEKGLTLMACHVDDCTLVGDSPAVEESFLLIGKTFTLRDTTKQGRYLGVNVLRNSDRFILDQNHLIVELTKEFLGNLENTRRYVTPWIDIGDISGEEKVSCDEDSSSGGNGITWYRKLVGKLNWICLNTRPDISFAVRELQRHLEKPTKTLCERGLRVINYLDYTKNWKLCFGNYVKQRNGEITLRLTGFADANFERKSEDMT